MGDFKSDFLAAVDDNGKGDVANAVGMPDDKDYEVLLRIIQKYQKLRPGYLEQAVANGRADYGRGIHHKKQIFDKSGRAVISKDSNMVYVFELPADLVRAIERFFPSMFKSKRHFAWFKKNFYKLTIGGTDK